MWRLVVLVTTLAVPLVAHARVAFVGLDGLGLDSTVVEPISQLVEAELSRLCQGDLVTPAQVKARLAEPGLERLRQSGGRFDILVDQGGVLDADFVVYGTLTKLGDNHVIVLRGIDVLEKKELPRIRETLRGSADDLLATVRGAATRLLAIDRYSGRLEIVDGVPDATIRIDGRAVSPVPGEPLVIGVGKHTVEIAAPNHRTKTAMVEVGYDEVAQINAGLEPLSGGVVSVRGLLRRWWPTAAASAGLMALVGSGVLGYRTHQTELDYRHAFKRNAEPLQFYADTRARGDSYALQANVALGFGLALVTAGIIGWWRTDEAWPEVRP